jgi:tetratricopeptide (TPR) repeat protein
MRQHRISQLVVAALLVLCFGLAAHLDVWFQAWQGSRTQNADVLSVLLGDGRRLFANHFFVKADAYFHSGYYPTVFDNREAFKTPHVAEDSGTVAGKNEGDETAFMGKPRDWIDAFSRDFLPATHTHLDQGGTLKDLGDSSEVREILPWLQLSAELNPNDIRTYLVTAYWLRRRMGKTDEAEQFLREGLRANPGSYAILFELGCLFEENHHDPARARNLWQVALRNCQKADPAKSDPDQFFLLGILAHLSRLEESEGNYSQALVYMDLWKAASPNPDAIQKQIDELRQRSLAAKPETTSATANLNQAP